MNGLNTSWMEPLISHFYSTKRVRFVHVHFVHFIHILQNIIYLQHYFQALSCTGQNFKILELHTHTRTSHAHKYFPQNHRYVKFSISNEIAVQINGLEYIGYGKFCAIKWKWHLKICVSQIFCFNLLKYVYRLLIHEYAFIMWSVGRWWWFWSSKTKYDLWTFGLILMNVLLCFLGLCLFSFFFVSADILFSSYGWWVLGKFCL